LFVPYSSINTSIHLDSTRTREGLRRFAVSFDDWMRNEIVLNSNCTLHLR